MSQYSQENTCVGTTLLSDSNSGFFPMNIFLAMAVRCEQDLLFSRQTYRVFESDLPCFDSYLPYLESDLPIFWVSPSHFSSQIFPFFPVSPSHFSKSVLLIFRLRPSDFFGSILPTFPSQFFSFFESDLLPIFFTVSFRLLPVLFSDLIAMCTVDKIKDVGVCRCLHYK